MMNTRGMTAEYRLAHWSQVMQDRKERRQSIKAYCESEGIHENVYYYWQRKLREAACEHISGIHVGKPVLPAFAEVKMANQTAQPPGQERPPNNEIRIEIADVRITANGTFPMETLAVLLREMARSC